jgi:hypothetical protein
MAQRAGRRDLEVPNLRRHNGLDEGVCGMPSSLSERCRLGGDRPERSPELVAFAGSEAELHPSR